MNKEQKRIMYHVMRRYGMRIYVGCGIIFLAGVATGVTAGVVLW